MSVIAINSKPETIDFSGNPICFVITAANVFQVDGTAAIGYLEKTGTAVAGEVIVISFLDFELCFTFRATPDDSGLQLTAGLSIDDTIGELRSNYYISRYFFVDVYNTSFIRFTAMEKGAGYTPVFNTDDCAAYSVGAGSVDGVDVVPNPNFKVYIQLLAASVNSSNFSQVCTSFLDCDELGKVYFYPGAILKSFFTDPAPPEYGQTAISTWLSPLLDYYICFAEYFGENPCIQKLHDHKPLRLINGKLHNNIWCTHDFINELAVSKIFLSNKPASSDVWFDSHEFLFFMNYVEEDYSFSACFDITYTDGTTTVKAKQIDYVDSVYMNIYAIPIGVKILALDLINPAKTIHSLKVYILHDTVLISEPRRFYLVNRPHKAIQLLFQNNYGCIDSILCTNAKFDLKHEADLVKKLLSHDYNISSGNDRAVVKDQLLTISTYTGFISQQEAYQLAELYENNNAWMVGNSDFIKIELTGASPTLIESDSALSNFEIKFRISVPGTPSLNELI